MLTSRAATHDIWAVGPTAATAGGPGAAYDYIAMHWDGSSWQTVSMPTVAPIQGTTSYPNGLVGLGPDNVWVSEVTSGGLGGNPGPEGTTLLHWNGTTWTQVSQDLSRRDFGLTVGGNGNFRLTDHTRANFVHYHAGTWTLVPPPSEPGYAESLADLARVPGTTSIWADANSSASDGLPGPGLILKHGS